MLKTYSVRLFYKKFVTRNILHLKFEVLNQKNFKFIAGQYVLFTIHTCIRQYSIVSRGINNEFELLIEIVPNGLASKYFKTLRLDTIVEIRASAGNFIYRKSKKTPIFLATGTGIAPIITMLYSFQNSKKPSILFWGLKRYQDIYFKKELMLLKKIIHKFSYTICLSRENQKNSSVVYLGHIQDALESYYIKYKSNPLDFDYYICGNKNMVLDVIAFLMQKQVTKKNIFYERFN